jgi:ATP-dependent DNA helicase RecG
MLRYGRPAPDYGMSDAHTVTVHMSSTEADLEFLKMILQREDQIGGALSIDSLIILSRLREERRLTTADLAVFVQKPETAVHANLEKLVEAGLVEAHGSGRGRLYTLSAKVYRHTGQKAAYVRQTGFDRIQQEQMVLSFIDKHGAIVRAEVADLCRIGPFQATRLLKKMTAGGLIRSKGLGKKTFYERT